MPIIPDNHSAQICMGVGGCGAHQQILAGPVASGDFTNIATNNAADGVYTLNGSPCAITDIIDLSNPNNAFDPVRDIDSGGIKAYDDGVGIHGRQLELKDPLKATVLADGMTIVLECLTGSAAPEGGVSIVPHDDDFNLNTFAECNLADTDLFALDENEYFSTSYKMLPNQINKVAFTLSDGRMAVSLNGGAVHAIESGCFSIGITNVSMSTAADLTSRLRSFVIYEVVDDADLPGLSAL